MCSISQLGLECYNYSIDEICKDINSKVIYECLFEKLIDGLDVSELIKKSTSNGILTIRYFHNSDFARLLLFRLFNLKKISLWCNRSFGENIPLINNHGNTHTTNFMLKKINYEDFKNLFLLDTSLTITEFIKI